MLQNHPTAFKTSYDEEAALPLERFTERYFAGDRGVVFGAYLGGALCGSARFERERRAKTAHTGALGSVYVRPALRGRGVGEALVQRVIDHARQQVSVLLCSVTSDSAAARRLYRRMGFVAYGLEPRALRYDGVDYDEELLVLMLD